ncbi:MAG: hypothetical protein AAB576_07355, partial [Elusimicrobiota bacterium]
VEVQLKRHDTGQCWGGTLGMGWVSGSGAVGASTGTRVVYPAVLAWNYPLTGELIPQWIDKTTYTFSSRGRNNADIAEQPPLPPGFPRTVDFYIDQSSPTSNLVYPANNAYIRTPPTLTGTVYDSGNGVVVSTASGIKDPNGILVNVKRKDAGPSFNYSWNHVTQLWDAPAYFSTATYYAVGSTWSFTAVPSSAVWLNGLVYEIQTQGIDKAFGAAAGNTEVPGAARTFTYDVALPTATIQTLNAGTTYSAVLASGTVADAAPGAVDYVQLLIKDHGTPTLPNDPPGYWDGTTWKFTGVFTTRAVVAGGDWSVVNLPNFEDRHFYTMVSSAVDKAGNPQSQFFFAVNNSSASFYADKAAPTITFNAPPSGDYYTKSMANVTGLVIDPNIVLDPDMTISAGVTGGANVLVQVKYFEGGTTYYWDGSNSFNTPGGGCANCTEPLAWESP